MDIKIDPLRFDFRVQLDENLYFLIEFDGQQHYQPVKLSQSVSDDVAEFNFMVSQFYDFVKTSYCTLTHIPLLRIPYTDINNIPEIIDNFINELQGYDEDDDEFNLEGLIDHFDDEENDELADGLASHLY